jgi:hypothetical protein
VVCSINNVCLFIATTKYIINDNNIHTQKKVAKRISKKPRLIMQRSAVTNSDIQRTYGTLCKTKTTIDNTKQIKLDQTDNISERSAKDDVLSGFN